MKRNVLVTGSGGLIGSEAVRFFCAKDFNVYGIDNNMREYYFGEEASTAPQIDKNKSIFKNYKHYFVDIRHEEEVEKIFKARNYELIIHTAAQPSHDWAAKEPSTDFTVNANGTLNLLENFRKHSPGGVFIFTSTNKVYGDTPNRLPLVEKDTRYELPKNHRFYKGIDETMSIDNSTHSLFGVSKASADLLVQEYGRYFNLYTASFRGGCLTGSGHAGTKLHGFLSYLVKSIITDSPYTVYGYKGKQVRDNIHSYDLINAFYSFYKKPRVGEVYNIGGSRFANISMNEAISRIEEITGKKARVDYSDDNRIGDHMWYVSDVSKFKNHYPDWDYKYDIDKTIEDICQNSAFSKTYESFSLSRDLDHWKDRNWYFHKSLSNIFKDIIPEGSSVLQIGYGIGDILSSIYPKKAVGVVDDQKLTDIAERRHPAFSFYRQKPEDLKVKGKFDYAILPNSADHFDDIQTVLEKTKKNLKNNGRLIMTNLNPRWQPIFHVLEKVGLKRVEQEKNWLQLKVLENLAYVSGYEILKKERKILIPGHIPFLSNFINSFDNDFLIGAMGVEQLVVAKPEKIKIDKSLSCSVVIPCYNEEDNIEQAIKRVPKMGKFTEIVVVDDGSKDNTAKIVKKLQKKMKNLKLISYKPNAGKGVAVRTGMDAAKGDIVMILDADMTVMPEELPRFFELLASGRAEFVNGTRLVYPMEDQAMRQLNLLGNVFFGHAFSWVLSQPVTDTLCGTKALFKKDYKNIYMSGKSWGDFDLLFGAAENGLKIIEMPVHYKARVAGESKMKFIKHGTVMIEKFFEGVKRLKIDPLFNKSKVNVEPNIQHE